MGGHKIGGGSGIGGIGGIAGIVEQFTPHHGRSLSHGSEPPSQPSLCNHELRENDRRQTGE